MKENYRFLGENIKEGYDLIFIARNTINGKKSRRCRQIDEQGRFEGWIV